MGDPFERFMHEQLSDGMTVEEIVARFAAMASGTKCRYCGRVGTKLCDYRIARASETGEELVCSAPLCGEHAITDPSLIFLRGEFGRETETIDYCHSHKNGSFGHRVDRIVKRKELYAMEENGLGRILIKEPEPLGPQLIIAETPRRPKPEEPK